MTASWQVGVDIGGAFTDIVALNPADNSLRTAKVRTEAGELVASLDHALVATLGFGDTLAIGRQNRRDLYRLDSTTPDGSVKLTPGRE